MISDNQKLLLTYLNQHCFNIYNTNNNYEDVLDNYFTIYSDGSGMHLALKYLFGIKFKSFNATDLNERILNYFIDNNISFL